MVQGRPHVVVMRRIEVLGSRGGEVMLGGPVGCRSVVFGEAVGGRRVVFGEPLRVGIGGAPARVDPRQETFEELNRVGPAATVSLVVAGGGGGGRVAGGGGGGGGAGGDGGVA